MENNARYFFVGVFALVVLLIGCIFIYMLVAFDKSSNNYIARIQFSGSVSGLAKGSRVNFNGIQVGEVKNIKFDHYNPDIVIVDVALEWDTPIKEDTKAGVAISGLSGIASVNLTGGSITAKNLSYLYNNGEEVVLHAEGSALPDIIETTRDVLHEVHQISSKISGSLDNNTKLVEKFLHSVNDILADFRKDAKGVTEILSSFIEGKKGSKLIGNMSVFLDTSNKVLEKLDVAAVNKIFKQSKSVIKDLKNSSQQITEITRKANLIVDGAKNLPSSIDKFANKLNEFSQNVDVADIAKVSKNIAQISDNLIKVTGVLNHTSKQFPTIVTKFDSLTEHLDDSAKMISPLFLGLTKVVSNINNSIKTQEISEGIASVSRAAKNIENITNFIDKDKIAGIFTKVDNSLANVDTFSKDLIQFSKPLNKTLDKVQSTSDKINLAADDLKIIAHNAAQLTSAINIKDVSNTISNVQKITSLVTQQDKKIDEITENIRLASQNFIIFSSSLAARGDDLDSLGRVLVSMSKKINITVSKLATSIQGFTEDFVGQNRGLVTEVQNTVRSVNKVAKDLQKQVNNVGGNINNLSNKGLIQLEMLTNQGRRALEKLERLTDKLEKKPNSIIFGSDNAPIYKPKN